MAPGFIILIPLMQKPSVAEVVNAYTTLPATIVHKVVIIDFDLDFTARTIRNFRSLRLSIVGVRGEPYFNKSLALNLGAKFCHGLLVVNDADIILSRDTLLAWHRALTSNKCDVCVPRSVKETKDGTVRPAPGICCLDACLYQASGGYCSEFEGWGLEDREFLQRLRARGARITECGTGTHLSHGDDERLRNYSISNLKDSRRRNLELMERRRRLRMTTGSLMEDQAAFVLSRSSAARYSTCEAILERGS